ncbi:undecaprenyl-phosphate glucose phosphotransferase [Flavobacteriales bacterium AH-315-E23]|nr:undecaprenyl-phosphate glucose phosphotransferase [Flavobacteriales bacterium AH-315-E23]
MVDRYSKIVSFMLRFTDLLLLNLAFLLASYTRFGNFLDVYYYYDSITDKYIFLIVIFNIVWVLVSSMLRIYQLYRVVSFEKVTINLVKSAVLHLLIIAIILVSLKEAQYMSRQFIFYTYVYFGIMLVIFRLSFLMFLRRVRATGVNNRNAVIVGAGPVGMGMREFLVKKTDFGFNFLGFFDDNGHETEQPDMVLGKVDDLKDYIKENRVEEIFCALPLAQTEKIRGLISLADNNLIRFKIVPDFRGFYNRKVSLDFYEDIPVLLRRAEPLENLFASFIKRSFDILFSAFVIIFILSWLTPILAVLIKLDSKGPVFFSQKRSGKVNEEFWCWKFRTMRVNGVQDEVQATKGDSRVTKLGAFLRGSSLDELPQFFNVIIGNMSVVGPRPHMLKHTEEYSKLIDKFMARHFIKPGITGLAQVRGYRGETKETDQMYRRARTDVWYIENWSFLLDIKIIYLTVVNGIKGDKMAY